MTKPYDREVPPTRPCAFRWDPHHQHPHTDLTALQKWWRSRRFWWSYVRLLGRNFAAFPSIWREYSHLRSNAPEFSPPITSEHLAVGFNPMFGETQRVLPLLRELGSKRLTVRVPCWDLESVLDNLDDFRLLHEEGFSFVFCLLQDRAALLNPAMWEDFVAATLERLGGFRSTFELGHAPNRKKWGVMQPDEYFRLLEGVAPYRHMAPQSRWIGPAVIDFEYYFTTHFLFAELPFAFDGVSALLYMDRRGSPDNPQYGRFNLREKLLLLKGLVDASPNAGVPLWLTEFNWCLRGQDKYNSAGMDVSTSEALQAKYLAIYYLTALSTGFVECASWWSLVGRGYGLIEDTETLRRRPAFDALALLLRKCEGGRILQHVPSPRGLRGFEIRHETHTTWFLYNEAGPTTVKLGAGEEYCHLLGGNLPTKGLTSVVVQSDPVLVTTSRDRPLFSESCE